MNRRLTVLIITVLTVAASLITIFVFFTGRNVPDLLPDLKHPVTTKSTPEAVKPLTPEKDMSAKKSGPTPSTPGQQKIEKSPGSVEPGESAEPVPIRPTKTQQTVQAKDFVFELKDCKTGGQTVSCSLTITNRGPDRNLFICGKMIPWPLKPEVKNITKMFDDSGNEYVITTARLANKSVKFGPYKYCVSSVLVSGIPTIATLNFDNVLQRTGMISLLEMSLVAGHEEDFLIQFRNIPLTR